MKMLLGTVLLIASAVTIDSFVRIPIKKKFRGLERRAVGVGNVTLKNLVDVAYVGEVFIGTPAQKFLLDFDTGSSDMWIPSKNCDQDDPGCNLNTQQHLVNAYDNNASSTYIPDGTPVNLQYGSGYASGIESIDTVTIGGLQIKNQTFVEAQQFFKDFITGEDAIGGIVGLAWRSLEEEKTTMPFENIFEQFGLPKMFSFYLNRNESGSPGGEIIIGGIDHNLVDESTIKYENVQPEYWTVDQDVSIEINGTTLNPGSGPIMDTGTTLIILPSWAAQEFNQIIRATFNTTYGVYLVDCSTYKSLPPVTFQIGNIDGTLGPEDYILLQDNLCISGIQKFDEDILVLGDVFLGQFYQVYDYENQRFGVGKLKNDL